MLMGLFTSLRLRRWFTYIFFRVSDSIPTTTTRNRLTFKFLIDLQLNHSTTVISITAVLPAAKQPQTTIDF